MFFRQKGSRFWLVLLISIVGVSLVITFIIDFKGLLYYSGVDVDPPDKDEEYIKLSRQYYDQTTLDTRVIIEIKEHSPSTGVARGSITVITNDPDALNSKYLLYRSFLFSSIADMSHTDVGIDSDGVMLSESKTFKINDEEAVIFSIDDISIVGGGPAFLFPFDYYDFFVENPVLINDKGVILEGKPYVEIVNQNSNAYMAKNYFLYNDGDIIPILTFYRPAYVITSILSVVILSLIISIWTFIRFLKSKEKNTEILAIMVSLAVSIPAFRQIQVPSEIKFAPLYDIPILIVWSVSVLTIFAYMLRRNESQEKQNDVEQENSAATEENSEETTTNETVQ